MGWTWVDTPWFTHRYADMNSRWVDVFEVAFADVENNEQGVSQHG